MKLLIQNLLLLSFLPFVAFSQTQTQVLFFDKPLQDTSVTNKLEKIVNDAKMPLATMDIEYGGWRCDGISTLFMMSETIGVDTGFESTGHLSCYSAMVNFGSEYFIAHVDADNCGQYKEVDSLLRAMILERIGTKTILSISFGASNLESDSIMNRRLEYMLSLFPSVEHEQIFFFCGPNGNKKQYTLKELFDGGGPDALITTDIIFLPKVEKIIVIRPNNQEKFNHSFYLSEWPAKLKTFKN